MRHRQHLIASDRRTPHLTLGAALRTGLHVVMVERDSLPVQWHPYPRRCDADRAAEQLRAARPDCVVDVLP